MLLLDLSPVFQLVTGLGPQKPTIGFLLLALVKEAILFCWPGWTGLDCAARYLVQQSLINPDPGLVAPPLPTLQAVPVPASRLPPSSISTQISSPSPSSQLFFSFNLVPKIRLRRLHYSRPAQSPIAIHSDQSDWIQPV